MLLILFTIKMLLIYGIVSAFSWETNQQNKTSTDLRFVENLHFIQNLPFSSFSSCILLSRFTGFEQRLTA